MRAAARFMASQSWCGQSVVRALRPAPERTHDFKTWPRISRNPSNPKPVTLEMCGVRVWTVVSGSPRCVGRASPSSRNDSHGCAALGLSPDSARLRLSLWIEDNVTCEWVVWLV